MFDDIKLRWLTLSGILVTCFEILSLSGISLPTEIALPLFLIIILAIGHETLISGVKALFQLNFRSINLLVVIAMLGAFYLGEYEEAAVVIVLFSLAEHLEDVGIAKSQSSLRRLIEKMPTVVFLKGESVAVPIDQIKPGQEILVKPFQMIPLDGIVLSGSSFVDEAAITGEPIAKEKENGDAVFAGTLNKQGVLEITVTKAQHESVFAKIQELTFSALENKAETEKFIEKFSKYYTPSILVFTFGWMFLPWILWSKPFIQGFAESLMLLVIACPCALVISTPISIFSAIGKAAQEGAVIKGGRYLEAIGKVTCIAFDKTRTLTRGEPEVTDVIPVKNKSRAEVLQCAAGVEIFSEHPLAESVVKLAERENISVHKLENFSSIVGKGATAKCHVCDDQEHFIGALQYLHENGEVTKQVSDEVIRLQKEGKSVMVLTTGSHVEGIIAIEDVIRKESESVIGSLNRMGVHTALLTGDHQQTADAVGKQVGVSEALAECLPEDKSRYISNRQQKGDLVAMVGDGINDAPALAFSDVGISMSGLGSDTAVEAASIVLLNDRLGIIPSLVKLGRKTLKIIKFNTIFAIVIKLFVVALAVMGVTNLAIAIFADVGVTILVILNSLRLRS